MTEYPAETSDCMGIAQGYAEPDGDFTECAKAVIQRALRDKLGCAIQW